jgi:hypothetical protein
VWLQVDALDQERCTPLMRACQSGSWAVGTLLIEAKANVKAVGKDQWTPLREWRVVQCDSNGTAASSPCVGKGTQGLVLL